jgi:hypothetical protein
MHFQVTLQAKMQDAKFTPGYQIYHNYIREHQGLDNKTPAEASDIRIEGENKWLTLIQNAKNNMD